MEQHAELEELIAAHRCAALATVDAQGLPCCSYAPYVYHQGCFWLLLSGLAAHSRNLVAQPNCELMVMEENQLTKNPFARRRASLRCQASVVVRQSVLFQEQAARFRQSFGPTAELLIGLPDFQMFRLKPSSASVILGFGQAVRLQFPSQAGHVDHADE